LKEMSRKRTKQQIAVGPKVIWARRVKWLAIILSFVLLVAAAFLLLQYKPPLNSPEAGPSQTGAGIKKQP